MAGESNADVYASFGVSSAVMSGSNQEEHEQNMLALDVAARDGDDAILLHDDEPQEVDLYGNPDKFAVEGEDDGFVQVRIGEEGSTEDYFESDAGEGTEGQAEEFAPLGDVPSELTETTEQLSQHAEGFQEIVNQAFERGVSEESITRI